MYFLPSQSVNDLRLINGNGTVMAYLIEPGEAPNASYTPSAVTWTAP